MADDERPDPMHTLLARQGEVLHGIGRLEGAVQAQGEKLTRMELTVAKQETRCDAVHTALDESRDQEHGRLIHLEQLREHDVAEHSIALQKQINGYAERKSTWLRSLLLAALTGIIGLAVGIGVRCFDSTLLAPAHANSPQQHNGADASAPRGTP